MKRSKSPAQLQREINEALRKRAMNLDPAQVGREITEGFERQQALEEALTPDQRAYVEALVEDVRLLPAAYKASVRTDPRAWAVKLADGLEDADARRMTRELRAETKSALRTLGRSSHTTKKPPRPRAAYFKSSRLFDREVAKRLAKTPPAPAAPPPPRHEKRKAHATKKAGASEGGAESLAFAAKWAEERFREDPTYAAFTPDMVWIDPAKVPNDKKREALKNLICSAAAKRWRALREQARVGLQRSSKHAT